jgi:hypothetical protein
MKPVPFSQMMRSELCLFSKNMKYSVDPREVTGKCPAYNGRWAGKLIPGNFRTRKASGDRKTGGREEAGATEASSMDGAPKRRVKKACFPVPGATGSLRYAVRLAPRACATPTTTHQVMTSVMDTWLGNDFILHCFIVSCSAVTRRTHGGFAEGEEGKGFLIS